MTTQPCYLYGDDRTMAVLRGDAPCVLLVGGYLGYSNFGDILQLKGTIRWHRRQSGLVPVVVCDVGAISDAGFPERVRRWFDIEGVIFVSGSRLDLEEIGLTELQEPQGVPCLHAYGGGFLNAQWGETMLAWIEAIHARFGVTHYVMSGQQVEPTFAPSLRKHFARCPPRITAGRDPLSAQALRACGVPHDDSFDDSVEAMGAFIGLHARGESAEERSCDALLHLNLSAYACPADQFTALGQCAELVRSIHASLTAAGDVPCVTLLQAYSDRRADAVVDTLAVVQQLEDSFPFSQYHVVDIGRLALELWNEEPTSVKGRFRAPIAIACSYHVTLMCSMMAVPCYFWANNPYYTQKRGGLGAGAPDIQAFLSAPAVLQLDERMSARAAWLARLAGVYEDIPAPRYPTAPSDPEPGSVRHKWFPKVSLPHLSAHIRELEQARRG